MKTKVYQLNTPVKEYPTGTEGVLTHILIDTELVQTYIFQAAGIKEDTKLPHDPIYIEKGRITDATIVDVDLPTQVIKSKCKETNSGFKGTIIGLVIHLGNCVHVTVKHNKDINVESKEFDMRRVTGEEVDKVNNPAVVVEEKKRPTSPISLPKRPNRSSGR